MPNLVMSVVFLAIAGLTLLQTRGFPEYDYSVVNSASFPRAIAILMIVFSVLLIVRDLGRRTRTKGDAIGLPLNRYGLIGFVATAVYISLVGVLGFLIPTILVLVFYSIILGKWKFRFIDGIVVPSIGIVSIVVMFSFLNVPLLKGLY